MKKKKYPSPRVLRRLIDFDPETGEMVWKIRPVWMFKPHGHTGSRKHSAKFWNSRYAGTPALNAPMKVGYNEGTIFAIRVTAHRAMWALVHGKWPEGQIDHINGVQTDNRIENLRDIPQAENARNSKRHVTNTSGVSGVCWDRKRQCWYARISVNNRNKFLGYSDDFDVAVSLRKAAEAKYAYHENHGRG